MKDISPPIVQYEVRLLLCNIDNYIHGSIVVIIIAKHSQEIILYGHLCQ
jgi:hypothetical protein